MRYEGFGVSNKLHGVKACRFGVLDSGLISQASINACAQ